MAKGNESSNLDRLAGQIKESLAGGLAEQINSATATDATGVIPSDSAGAVSLESTPPAETPSASAAASSPAIATNATPTDLSAFVSGLTQEQLSRVRDLARARGLSAGPQRGPNGGLMVTIEIPSEACEPLQTWADSAGTTFEKFVCQVAGDAITNYCFGDWGATVVQPVTPIATVIPPAVTT